MIKDKPTVFVPLSKRPIQLKTYLMAGVASWVYYIWSFNAELVQYTLVQVLISTPPDFWCLCMYVSLHSACNVSYALSPVITHFLVVHCLHATFDLYRQLNSWNAAQITSLSRVHSPLPAILSSCVFLYPPPLPIYTWPDLMPYALAT